MTRPAYREHAPGPSLAPYVECFWTIKTAAPLDAPVLNRVLPDGCMDIIVDASETGTTRSFVVGPMSRALNVRLESAVDLLGIRFLPGALPSFLHQSAYELLDLRVDLEAFWKADARRVREVFPEQSSLPERLRLISDILLRHRPTETAVVVGAVEITKRTHGSLPIEDLAHAVGIGRRRLERRFREHVGLSPKQMARIVRLRFAVRSMARQDPVSWAQLALECGYYDQAHLIRDFQNLTGTTPEAYRAERVHGVALEAVY